MQGEDEAGEVPLQVYEADISDISDLDQSESGEDEVTSSSPAINIPRSSPSSPENDSNTDTESVAAIHLKTVLGFGLWCENSSVS